MDNVIIPVAIVASFFAFTSGMYYVADAVRQISAAGEGKPDGS
jgi:hypothetical protein